MDEDEDMQDQEEEQGLRQEVIKFGEAKLATEATRAAAIAQGNIEVHDADTLEMPQVGFELQELFMNALGAIRCHSHAQRADLIT